MRRPRHSPGPRIHARICDRILKSRRAYSRNPSRRRALMLAAIAEITAHTYGTALFIQLSRKQRIIVKLYLQALLFKGSVEITPTYSSNNS